MCLKLVEAVKTVEIGSEGKEKEERGREKRTRRKEDDPQGGREVLALASGTSQSQERGPWGLRI